MLVPIGSPPLYCVIFVVNMGIQKMFVLKKVGFPSQDNKFNNTKKLCTYSNRNGHTVDTCYKKHGYPPGYKFYNNNRANQVDNLVVTDGIL